MFPSSHLHTLNKSLNFKSRKNQSIIPIRFVAWYYIDTFFCNCFKCRGWIKVCALNPMINVSLIKKGSNRHAKIKKPKHFNKCMLSRYFMDQIIIFIQLAYYKIITRFRSNIGRIGQTIVQFSLFYRRATTLLFWWLPPPFILIIYIYGCNGLFLYK